MSRQGLGCPRSAVDGSERYFLLYLQLLSKCEVF